MIRNSCVSCNWIYKEEMLGSKKKNNICTKRWLLCLPSYLAAFFAQSVFVKQVFGHAVLRRAHAAQVGHPVAQFFDGLDLLVQEMCLDKVAQLKIGGKHRSKNLKTNRSERSVDFTSLLKCGN